MTWLVQTNKAGANRRGEAERRQRAVRRFTRFVDYGLRAPVRKNRPKFLISWQEFKN